MARFEICHAKAGVNTANTIMWQLRAAASSRTRIFEIHLSIAVAPTTGPSWRLNRVTAVGTSSATVTAEEQDPGGGAPATVLDTAWSANPTLATNDMRKYATSSSIGSGIVWTWPDHRPLILPVSLGLAVVNANAAGTTVGTFNVTFIIEE